MTQLAAGNRAEADTMHAAIVAFAKPHLDTAGDVMLRAAQDIEAILDNVPSQMRERDDLTEFAELAKRYAARVGVEEPPVQEQAPTLGVARRLAIQQINDQADGRVDGIVVMWAQGMDLPVMDVGRIVDAALVMAASITNKRTVGVELSPQETAAELGLQAMQHAQQLIRETQRDHIRNIDALEEIDEVRAYPATAAWPS